MSGQVSSTGGSAVVDPRSREATRRHLTHRQAATVQGLVDAAVDEVRVSGYDGLTVRNVARRAGVAPATAYTYFSSKDHLVTEVFWRRLAALPEADPDLGVPVADRLGAALAEVALVVADEPELAAACTVAMLGADADVRLLRERIGAEIRRRTVAALGPDAEQVDRAVLHTADLVLTGALVQAGVSDVSYDQMARRVAEAANLLLRS